MQYTEEQIEALSKTVFNFHKKIEEMNHDYERPFTMDGHMIGSVGEIFASYYYGIVLYEPGHKLHDGYKDKKQIQVKITQRDQVEVKGIPEQLIVLRISFSETKMDLYEVYNGPGSIVLKDKACEDNKETSLSINKLSRIQVDNKDRVLPENKIIRLEDIYK